MRLAYWTLCCTAALILGSDPSYAQRKGGGEIIFKRGTTITVPTPARDDRWPPEPISRLGPESGLPQPAAPQPVAPQPPASQPPPPNVVSQPVPPPPAPLTRAEAKKRDEALVQRAEARVKKSTLYKDTLVKILDDAKKLQYPREPMSEIDIFRLSLKIKDRLVKMGLCDSVPGCQTIQRYEIEKKAQELSEAIIKEQQVIDWDWIRKSQSMY
jgi:hypothetical protein